MGGDANKKSINEVFTDLVKAGREYLVYQQEKGLEGIDLELLNEAAKKHGNPSQRNPAEELRAVKRELGDCTRCSLSQDRINIVFGEGDPLARLMFVGEGPGEDEDAQGLPFVGKSGRMLTDIIEKGMKMSRSEVYITSVVKCRPPKNRNPEPLEIQTCFPFLEKQVDSIKPRVIIALGAVAAHALTGLTGPISKIRGTWQEFGGTPVMPTYHPSYLLRQPAAKKEVWEDIKQVMHKLGLPVEEKK